MEHVILDIEKQPEKKPVPTLQDIYNMQFPTATIEELEEIIFKGICISTVMIDTIQGRIDELKAVASIEESAKLLLIEDKLNEILSILDINDINNVKAPSFNDQDKIYLDSLRNITTVSKNETSILQALPKELLKSILYNLPLHLRLSRETVSRYFRETIENMQIEPVFIYKMFVIFTENLKLLDDKNIKPVNTYALLKQNKKFHQFFTRKPDSNIEQRHAEYAQHNILKTQPEIIKNERYKNILYLASVGIAMGMAIGLIIYNQASGVYTNSTRISNSTKSANVAIGYTISGLVVLGCLVVIGHYVGKIHLQFAGENAKDKFREMIPKSQNKNISINDAADSSGEGPRIEEIEMDDEETNLMESRIKPGKR